MIIIIVIIINTRPQPTLALMGWSGLDTAWAGIFWDFFNVSLHTSDAELGTNSDFVWIYVIFSLFLTLRFKFSDFKLQLKSIHCLPIIFFPCQRVLETSQRRSQNSSYDATREHDHFSLYIELYIQRLINCDQLCSFL